MYDPTYDLDEFEDSTDLFHTRFKSNRQRKLERQQPRRTPQSRPDHPAAAIASQREGEDEFTPSLHTSPNEQRMLQNELTYFYHEQVITDVLAPVKGGKEATVYCCQAHANTGVPLIAAKIYRPRAFRSLRNDAPYKEGREMLDDEGKGIRDTRRQRALAKKTDYGKAVDIASWIEHEWATLRLLHDAGVDVPRPISRANNTILMEYLGEERWPAPNLHSVPLRPVEARRLFEQLLANVELMLAHNRVHADLSAFNILYWQGRAVIIDFPQAVFALSNRNAFGFLQRDLERLTQHFGRYGIEANPADLARDLWQRHQNAEL